MAFFEDLGKRLSNAGQGVAQSTKNFADVSRLNNAVSEKERQIAQLFSTIGSNYYEAHKDDPDAEQRQLLEQVKALRDDIARCQNEIMLIRGVAKCPNCGSDVNVNAAFCTFCGTPVPRPAQPAAPVPTPAPVPNPVPYPVQNPVPGPVPYPAQNPAPYPVQPPAPVTAPETEPAPASEAAPAPGAEPAPEAEPVTGTEAAPPPPPASPVCPNCGSPVSGTSAFCTICGTKLS